MAEKTEDETGTGTTTATAVDPEGQTAVALDAQTEERPEEAAAQEHPE